MGTELQRGPPGGLPDRWVSAGPCVCVQVTKMRAEGAGVSGFLWLTQGMKSCGKTSQSKGRGVESSELIAFAPDAAGSGPSRQS